MALTQVTGPYPIFTDLDGSPLDDGYLYIGVINEDPETNPIQVYWDSNLTIPATQPIRTNSGYAYRNGTPALLYTAGEFSITIRNKRQEFVLYSPVGYGFDPAAVSASVVKNDFIGDGVEVDFTLSASPSTKLATNVFINGVYQEKDSYSLSGNVITFSIAPPISSSIEVMTNETGIINSGNATAITYTASFPGAVQQTVQTKLEQYVSVKDFGAVGDGVTDDTVAMQAAHDTGQTVYYPQGVYNFTNITIPSGGIIGEGKLTILRTTDTGTGDVITYTGVDSSGLLVNTVGGLFKDFTLWANTPTQKATGAGISVVPASGENYLTICDGIYVRNIPTGVSFTLGSYFSVVNSYFAFFTVAGIYSDMDDPLFQDNGDNVISGNAFFTNAVTSPSARAIWYRGGGAKIIGNKINGGMIGVDINPLRGTSVAIVEGNSVENQTLNALRGYIGNDFTPIGAGDGFSFLQFVGNQIGGYNLTGPAISIDSYASDPKFYNCMVSDNIVFNPVNYGARAIDIRQVDRFVVANNLVDNSAVGYGSLFVASSATSGLVTRNQFLRAATSNVLNSSTTTALDQIVSQAAQSEAIGTINAGASYVAGIATTANVGDYASASVEADTNGCIITADVYATNAVRVVIYNPTASPIVVGTANVRVRVISK